MWDCILSILVVFHLLSEYIHYGLEYFSGRKEGSVLKDILHHRKHSKKTELLEQIQKDLNKIKQALEIRED